MARIVLGTEALEIELSLVDEILSLHGRFAIPYGHIRAVQADPVPPAIMRGVRIGTNLPGVKVAGTFIAPDGVTYYDFHNPDRCVTLELDHDRYARVVVEVEPDQTAATVAQAIHQKIGG